MQLTAIRDLVERPGPFVTVHAEVGRPTEDARQQLEARWTRIRHTLEHGGVDEALVEEIGERLHEAPPGPGEARRTIVAADGRVVFDEALPGTVRVPETAEVGPLPDLAGWVAAAERQLPFCLVLADRQGADVTFYDGLADRQGETTEVQGADHYIRKVPQGDWAHKQFQQTAENRWKETAEEVADAVRTGVRQHPTRVVLLAGDDRARHLVEEALEGLQVPVVHVRSGGRAAGSSEEALWTEVAADLARFEADDDLTITERLAAGTGQAAAAVRGVDDVLDALVKGQVETVVLDLAAARDLSVDPAGHPGLPLPKGASGPLPADRVLVTAAAATSAGVAVLPREQIGGEGVAAVLRWDDATAPGR